MQLSWFGNLGEGNEKCCRLVKLEHTVIISQEIEEYNFAKWKNMLEF